MHLFFEVYHACYFRSCICWLILVEYSVTYYIFKLNLNWMTFWILRSLWASIIHLCSSTPSNMIVQLNNIYQIEQGNDWITGLVLNHTIEKNIIVPCLAELGTRMSQQRNKLTLNMTNIAVQISWWKKIWHINKKRSPPPWTSTCHPPCCKINLNNSKLML